MDKKTKEEKIMDMGEYYRNTRDRVLPTDFKEHFEQSKRSMEKNLKILKDIAPPNSVTEEGKALFKIVTIISERIFYSIDSISSDVEALFVSQFLNKDRFKDIHNVLEKHGMKIENMVDDEGIKWLNNYFKHVSETTND